MMTMQIKIQFFFFQKCNFSSYAEKQCGRQFWNAVEREPVEIRVYRERSELQTETT